jgi:3-methyladenine DNA glycosylase/8-oxoguanine DNA glycosylase
MTTMTLSKLVRLGYPVYDATLMLTALTRLCDYRMVQERNWFPCKGKMTLGLRTVRSVTKEQGLHIIARMIAKSETSRKINKKMWEDLQTCFERIEQYETSLIK